MAILKRSTDLDISDIDTFIAENDTDALEMLTWDDNILTTNEDGMMVDITVEKHHDGITYIVTDMLDSGWMVEHRFLPDGTIETHKMR